MNDDFTYAKFVKILKFFTERYGVSKILKKLGMSRNTFYYSISERAKNSEGSKKTAFLNIAKIAYMLDKDVGDLVDLDVFFEGVNKFSEEEKFMFNKFIDL